MVPNIEDLEIATSREARRAEVAKSVLEQLASMSGIDVLPANVWGFLNRVEGFHFEMCGKGKSRYVYQILDEQFGDLDLVLKVGGAIQNELEWQNAERHPEDFPRLYGAFKYAIVAEAAKMVDIDKDLRCKNGVVKARIKQFKARYGDIGSNIGFIGDRVVIVDGGVPYREN